MPPIRLLPRRDIGLIITTNELPSRTTRNISSRQRYRAIAVAIYFQLYFSFPLHAAGLRRVQSREEPEAPPLG